MKKSRIGIIGAGPAGLTAGYQLSKEGYSVVVYEASDQVGGLSKTIDLWDQKVDLGPHRFFSQDRRVNELWLEVAEKEYFMVNRLTRIYYKGKFYQYPLKPFEALKKLGFVQGFLCLLSYLKEKIVPIPQDNSFENWVIGRFGKRLYSIFFKSYSEKLWGISCKDLDKSFAAQRIKKLSLLEAIKNGFFSKRKAKHRTLADQFARPVGGNGAIYEKMKHAIEANGGKVLCSVPVKSVLVNQNKATAIELESNQIEAFDYIVSTMPITSLIKSIPNVPQPVSQAATALRFRNTLLVYLEVEGKGLFPDNWLYIHSEQFKVGRITNFSNWRQQNDTTPTNTIVTLEYWSYDSGDLWKMTNEELIQLGKSELKKTGLIGNHTISKGHVIKIPKSYPLYKKDYHVPLNQIETYLTGITNLSVIGRYGSFKYNNQDHSILVGMLAAENIDKGAEHNLWEINTDYDEYQESSTITSTGLYIETKS